MADILHKFLTLSTHMSRNNSKCIRIHDYMKACYAQNIWLLNVDNAILSVTGFTQA